MSLVALVLFSSTSQNCAIAERTSLNKFVHFKEFLDWILWFQWSVICLSFPFWQHIIPIYIFKMVDSSPWILLHFGLWTEESKSLSRMSGILWVLHLTWSINLTPIFQPISIQICIIDVLEQTKSWFSIWPCRINVILIHFTVRTHNIAFKLTWTYTFLIKVNVFVICLIHFLDVINS